MRYLLFIPICAMLALASCLDDNIEPDFQQGVVNHPCYDSLLCLYSFIPHDGRELKPCESRLDMYIYEDEPWFHVYNPCINRGEVQITDCSATGNLVEDFEDFKENSVYRGVVGIYDVEALKNPCLDSILAEFQMIRYDGRELDICDERLQMYYYRGTQWFDFVGPCITYAPIPPAACTTDPTEFDGNDYWQNKVLLGVVGIYDD